MNFYWKQIRYRLEYIACKTLAALIPRLPRRACLVLAGVLARLYYRFDRKTRAVALENLRLAFGDAHTSAERERIARASFGNFSRAMLDLFWARRLNRENFRRYLKMEGFDQARALRDKHGGVIFVVQHFGSYEWLSLGVGFAGMPVWIVAMDFKNKALEAVFRRARSHSGHTLIGRDLSMLKLLRAVRRNGGVGMLVDLALNVNMPGAIIEAFGRKMHVTILHALLHERTGIPMVPLTNVPHADGTCTITAHPPLEFPPGTTHQQMAQGCWDWFEPKIREQPEFWLWNYKHWRYKPYGAVKVQYPSYAHVNDSFERILLGERAMPRPGTPYLFPFNGKEVVPEQA